MGVESVLPRPFTNVVPDEERNSAKATAVREFFPILLILLAVDISTDGVILKTYTVVPGLTNPVPAYVYMYAFLGAGAYAVTSLAFNPKQSIVDTYRLTYRLIGALPLAAGMYVLADLIVASESLPKPPIAGLAFLSGLYVRLALKRLSHVAERLYGAANDDQDRVRTETTENLRDGWRRLSTASPPEENRQRGRGLLERAETIVDDDDATVQELERARDLSKQALKVLDGATEDASGTAETTEGDEQPAVHGETD